MEEMLAKAVKAKELAFKKADQHKALTILYAQKSGVDIECPEIAILNLSKAEKFELLNTFTANPVPPDSVERSNDTSGSQHNVTMLAADFIMIGEHVSHEEADAFDHMASQLENKKYPLTKFVTKHGEFLISSTFEANSASFFSI